MNLNRIPIHVIFVCILAILFAKLDDGAPLAGLVFMNALLVFAGIVYGMFIMRNTYKKQIKDALEELKK
jgi:hypothetical protein